MEREIQWNSSSDRERNGFVREAVRAAVAAAILILLVLTLTAGIFGADYGMRKAAVQTKEQIEEIMSSYGLSEIQRETLYQEMLERLKEMLASGELAFDGSFSPEDASRLRLEMEKHMEETLWDYMTSDELEKMLEEIMIALQKDQQETNGLFTQIDQMYEQYIMVHEQKLEILQKQFQNYMELQEEIMQALEKHFEEELTAVRDMVSEVGKAHGSELQRLAEKFSGLTSDLGELLNRILKNEEDIKTVFQLVSNGKALLASTITDEGVETAADAAFEEMAENIREIARIKYEEGKSDAKLTAQYIVNTGSCASYDDWTYNSYTAPKSGNCWIVGYFLLHGSGGGDGNDVDADVWIEQNGSRIYGNTVDDYIPGTGSRSYIFYVQQEVEVTKGDRFLLGFHIVPDTSKEGKRGNTGTMQQISMSLLYPQEAENTSAQAATASFQDLSSLMVMEIQGQQTEARQETEEDIVREEASGESCKEAIKTSKENSAEEAGAPKEGGAEELPERNNAEENEKSKETETEEKDTSKEDDTDGEKNMTIESEKSERQEPGKESYTVQD